jgi:hypothetical protein
MAPLGVPAREVIRRRASSQVRTDIHQEVFLERVGAVELLNRILHGRGKFAETDQPLVDDLGACFDRLHTLLHVMIHCFAPEFPHLRWFGCVRFGPPLFQS